MPHGVVHAVSSPAYTLCPRPRPRPLQVKQRQGVVERVQNDGTTAIVRSIFKKETDISAFTKLKVREAPVLPRATTTTRLGPGIAIAWKWLHAFLVEGFFGLHACMHVPMEHPMQYAASDPIPWRHAVLATHHHAAIQ